MKNYLNMNNEYEFRKSKSILAISSQGRGSGFNPYLGDIADRRCDIGKHASQTSLVLDNSVRRKVPPLEYYYI